MSLARNIISSDTQGCPQKTTVERCFGHTHNHTHLYSVYSVLSQNGKGKAYVDKIWGGGRKMNVEKR